ncbi:MAG TPA: DUF4160 domain-containing protein [Phycisphaerales bacterium]|nr:DUF4160 domain-containing protein [Phycisphaerales bacterium]
MPTIWHEQGFRFSFYSSDGDEPAHIHVTKDDKRAKWWLVPVREARSVGFSARERRAIGRIVVERRAFFLAAWDDFFTG